MGPKRPLSCASAEEQNQKVKKVMTVEKVKLLDRLESGARVTVLVKDYNVNESTIHCIRQCNDKIRITST